MPNRPIDFKFTSEVVSLLNGLNKAELSVEDLEQAFIEASNSSADLERKISKATREAERDVEKLERAIKDLPKESDKAADQVVKDFDKIGDEAGEAGKETASEFKQNLGSGLASGASPVEIITETLGGLVSSLSGPIGLAAAGLAGVGALAFQRLQQNAEETAALVDGYITQMRDRLGMAATEIDEAFKRQEFEDYVKEHIDYFQDINDELQRAGVGADEYAQALYDGGQAQRDMEERLRGILAAHGQLEGPVGRQKIVYDETGRAAEALLGQVNKLEPAQKEVNDEARVFAAIMGEASGSIDNIAKMDWNLDGQVSQADAIAQSMADAHRTMQQMAQINFLASTKMESRTSGGYVQAGYAVHGSGYAAKY